MFKENLKKLRLSYGLTQKELAETLGTSQQSYMRWETGKVSPTLTSVEKIAELFDIPISKLVSDKFLSLEEIFQAEHIDYQGQPLSEEMKMYFQFYVDNFIKQHLSHYSDRIVTKNILTKDGRWASSTSKDF